VHLKVLLPGGCCHLQIDLRKVNRAIFPDQPKFRSHPTRRQLKLIPFLSLKLRSLCSGLIQRFVNLSGQPEVM